LKDREVELQNFITSNPTYDIKVKEGDRVVLEVEQNDEKEVNITAKDNSPIILILLGVFFLAFLSIGGYKGLKSLTSILFTTFLIFFGLLPAILNGHSPILITILVVTISSIFGIFLNEGINAKSICSILGVIFSLTLAGLLSHLFISLASINGIDSQEGTFLWGEYPDLNFKGILTSAIMIGTLGAITSVGTSVTYHINKFKKTQKNYSFDELFHSGISKGKNIIAPIANTLIFAYIGNALPLLLLSFNTPFLKFINSNSLIIEIFAALIGSISIIFCVPITAAIYAYFCHITRKPS